MFITRVKVTNFRSLANADIQLDRYTALVGLNDSGKSNLLRALNLFFNGQTDPGHPLVFENDFSQHAKVIGKKARQIVIELEFSPPSNYADSGPIIWGKTYRSDSIDPYDDYVFRKNRKPFSKGSRAEYWVRHIAFEYVPAIRGQHFFAILKRRLYTTLAATVAPKLTRASTSFLSDLRKEVKKIESESQRLLHLKTEFSLPADLGELFEVLDFNAADGHARTALQYRGDGIQGRHIPLILKFLADQRKFASAKGKPPSETVWGFEEPENNLELTKQIEAAAEFKEYSSSVQIVVSTHSPAFYGMAKEAGRISIAVRDKGQTSFVDSRSPQAIDDHLGLMPFVEPYLEQAQRERDELIAQVKQLKAEVLIRNRPVLYVEGAIDKVVLEAAIATLELPKNFDIVAKDGPGGGANWVAGCCVARAAMTDISEKTAALFDDDQAGRDGAEKVDKRCEAIGRAKRIKCFTVARKTGDDEIRTLKKAKINIPFTIEELYGPEIWDYAERKAWLVEREDLIPANVNLLKKDKTLDEVLDAILDDQNVRRLVDYRVHEDFKSRLSKRAVRLITESGSVPPSLEMLVQEITAYFGT